MLKIERLYILSRQFISLFAFTFRFCFHRHHLQSIMYLWGSLEDNNGMESSKCTLQIGQFEGHALKLKGHDSIRRGVAYQAGMAYNLLTEEERAKFDEPSWFGTPSQKPPVLERIAAGRNFALSTEYNEDAMEDEE